MTDRETLNETLGMKLVHIARLYRRSLDASLRPYGLSDATALPLQYLARLRDDVRQGELAAMMDIEGPTLVRILDQLVATGLVERVEDSEDRRAKLVRLTDEGKALNEVMGATLRTLRAELFAGSSDEEIQVVIDVFDRLDTRLRDCPEA
jgi:MarR family transcriptional regulator for hemolysin